MRSPNTESRWLKSLQSPPDPDLSLQILEAISSEQTRQFFRRAYCRKCCAVHWVRKTQQAEPREISWATECVRVT